MLGAFLIVIALLFVFPPLVFVTFGALASGIAWILNDDSATRNEGSELLDLNV